MDATVAMASSSIEVVICYAKNTKKTVGRWLSPAAYCFGAFRLFYLETSERHAGESSPSLGDLIGSIATVDRSPEDIRV